MSTFHADTLVKTDEILANIPQIKSYQIHDAGVKHTDFHSVWDIVEGSLSVWRCHFDIRIGLVEFC